MQFQITAAVWSIWHTVLKSSFFGMYFKLFLILIYYENMRNVYLCKSSFVYFDLFSDAK